MITTILQFSQVVLKPLDLVVQVVLLNLLLSGGTSALVLFRLKTLGFTSKPIASGR